MCRWSSLLRQVTPVPTNHSTRSGGDFAECLGCIALAAVVPSPLVFHWGARAKRSGWGVIFPAFFPDLIQISKAKNCNVKGLGEKNGQQYFQFSHFILSNWEALAEEGFVTPSSEHFCYTMRGSWPVCQEKQEFRKSIKLAKAASMRHGSKPDAVLVELLAFFCRKGTDVKPYIIQVCRFSTCPHCQGNELRSTTDCAKKWNRATDSDTHS